MLTEGAIQELAKAQAISAANAAIDREQHGQVALPNDFTLIDMEKYLKYRRRMRGNMVTSIVKDFADYTGTNAERGMAVFVNPDNMTAVSVLNLGTPEEPGHADNTAVLELKRTAAYSSLRMYADGSARQQSAVAEFIEDWVDCIECFHETDAVPSSRAIAAVRKITIESLKKLESEEKQLSASKSAFESVHATSTEPLPTKIVFTCKPYNDIKPRVFVMRLGILTGGDKPAVNLRIIKIEEHEEQMAQELVGIIKESLGGDLAPVAVGKYSVK